MRSSRSTAFSNTLPVVLHKEMNVPFQHAKTETPFKQMKDMRGGQVAQICDPRAGYRNGELIYLCGGTWVDLTTEVIYLHDDPCLEWKVEIFPPGTQFEMTVRGNDHDPDPSDREPPF